MPPGLAACAEVAGGRDSVLDIVNGTLKARGLDHDRPSRIAKVRTPGFLLCCAQAGSLAFAPPHLEMANRLLSRRSARPFHSPHGRFAGWQQRLRRSADD